MYIKDAIKTASNFLSLNSWILWIIGKVISIPIGLRAVKHWLNVWYKQREKLDRFVQAYFSFIKNF